MQRRLALPVCGRCRVCVVPNGCGCSRSGRTIARYTAEGRADVSKRVRFDPSVSVEICLYNCLSFLLP